MAAMARAIATRRRWPPERSDGILSMCSPRPTKPEHFLDARAHLVERQRSLFVQLVADVLAHRERVEERALLEDHARGRRGTPISSDFVHLVDALAVDPDRRPSPASAARGSASGWSTSRHRWRPGRSWCAPRQREADVAQDHLVVERQRHLVEQHDGRALPSRISTGRPASARDSRRHQNSIEISSRVTKKSTTSTVTEAATTALVVARPTPWVPPRVRSPTWQPMLTMTKPRKNGLIEPHPDVLRIEAVEHRLSSRRSMPRAAA